MTDEERKNRALDICLSTPSQYEIWGTSDDDEE
jgi:hypothetical protein